MKEDRKVKEQRALPPGIATLLGALNSELRRWAEGLQQRVGGVSPVTLKWGLGVFCALGLGGSTCLVVGSLHRKSEALVVTPIRTLPLRRDKGEQGPPITQDEWERIRWFKTCLDSLGATASGRALRDSLLHHRPYLLDSLSYLERLYSQQQKNETVWKND